MKTNKPGYTIIRTTASTREGWGQAGVCHNCTPMKKALYLLVMVSVLLACSKSPEEKANELIKKEVAKYLYKPETYDPIETQVDSAFAPFDDPEVFDMLKDFKKLREELEEFQRKAKFAKSDMEDNSYFYSGTYGKHRYADAKDEFETATAKIKKLKEKVHDKYYEIAERFTLEDKFLGYVVFHRFRADNNAGNTLIDNFIFIVDSEFKEPLYICTLAEYNQIQESLKELAETDEMRSLWE